MKFLIYAALIICFTDVLGQTGSKNFSVGFKTIHLTDSSRQYKPGVTPSHPLFYRPIDLDVWYPASSTTGSALRMGDFIQLLEDRSGSYQQESDYDSIAKELTTYFALSLDADASAFAGFETESYKNAEPSPGKFPLIIYYASFNGMSFENVLLFEALVRHGYVIACINSVGRYPGDMSTLVDDVKEQMYDGLVARKVLSTFPLVDPERTGLMGYSWGSIAACMSATQMRAKAFVSLDGSEHHVYGLDDDNYFVNVREGITAATLALPYLYLQKDSIEADVDSVYAHHRRVKGSESIRIKNSTHEDFSSLPFIASRIRESRSSHPFQTIRQMTIAFMDEYLKGTKVFQSTKVNFSSQNLLDTLPQTDGSRQQDLCLSGIVKEKETGNPVPYASIGLPGKNFGTVSNLKGVFTLSFPADENDTLKISSIGFEDVDLPLKRVDPKKLLTIHLTEKTMSMTPVTVEATQLKTRTLGHTTRSKFFGGKLASDQLGTAIGVRMNIRKPVLLDQFRFTISYSQIDTALFRLNIFSLKDGIPRESLMHENIYCRVGKRTGTYIIDLLPYQITASRDIVMALEWIEGGSGGIRDYIVFSASPVNNGTYLKYASQGKWKRVKGMGVGFHVTVRVLDEEEVLEKN